MASSTIDQLLAYLFDGIKIGLLRQFKPTFAQRVRDSRRFREFVTTYRGKIHSKMRQVRDDTEARDFIFELEIAYWLVQDRRLHVHYEKMIAEKVRGPDFTVNLGEKTFFHVEVTRMRSPTPDVEKLMEVLCDKLGQMQPSAAGVLVIATEWGASEADIDMAARRLKLLADQKDEIYFQRRGFKNAADFLRQFTRLSTVVSWASPQNILWHNKLARFPLAKDMANLWLIAK